MLLEDHLHISLVRRRNALPLFKLQMRLVEDLVLTEKAIEHYKNELKTRQTLLDSRPGEKAELEREIRAIERELHFHQVERRAIRDIGDGVAWRLFDYDRGILQELANRPSGKRVNLEGIEAELHEFGRVFNAREGIAVLNDLTHFLKLGDVTVRKNDGSFEFVEVKKGCKTSGRITRQRQELARTVTFFNIGEREEVEGQQSILELEIQPESFCANIQRLIEEAGRKGAAVTRIGEHLIVQCTDFPRAVETGAEECLMILNQANDWVDEWRRKDGFVVDMLSTDRYLEVRNFAPFSIFPFSEPDRVKLMTGALWIKAHINVSAFLKYCEQRGWKVTESPAGILEEAEKSEGGKSLRLAAIRKGPLTIRLPGPLIGRLGHEF